MYEATRKWLKERLQLDINEEKSGIINLRSRYSEFLGIKLKLRRKGRTKQGNHNYVIKSHIGDKAQLNILENIKTHVKRMQKPKDHNPFKAVSAYMSAPEKYRWDCLPSNPRSVPTGRSLY